MNRRMLLVPVLVVLGIWGTGSAYAGVILTGTHNYNWGAVTNAVTIDVSVTQAVPSGNYLWQYTVTNNGFNPAGGNGLSGFELGLPSFPADLGNVTSPAGWNNNCCSGMPEEWDKPSGPGILVGQSGVFSFTSLPRNITNSTGWFHTWSGGIQIVIVNYSDTIGAVGPEVPNVLLPPTTVPEPSTLVLFAGAAALLLINRRRCAR